MNTKTLLLLGALGAAGMTSAVAQTNVYSVNAVGYVNKTVPAGFSLISNPLNAPTNSLQNVVKGVPENTQIFKFSGSTFVTRTFSSGDGGWIDNNLNLVDLAFAPGEGAFIFNPSVSPITVTFVGEVPQGSLTNTMPAGFSLKGSIVPQAGLLVTDLGFTAGVGDQVFKFVSGSNQTFNYVGVNQWEDNNLNPVTQPSLGVGESAFFFKLSGSQPWIRNFSVNN